MDNNQKSDLSKTVVEYRETIRIENMNRDVVICYNQLPISNRYPEPCRGELNGIPCAIFKKKSYRKMMEYLSEKKPLMVWLEDQWEYSPSIIDMFIGHDHAVPFTAEVSGKNRHMIAVVDGPLWDGAESDFSYMHNLINYVSDSQEDPENVFMDDYGLC